MAIYDITTDSLRQRTATSFTKAGIKKCGDLQRILQTQIGVIELNRKQVGATSPRDAQRFSQKIATDGFSLKLTSPIKCRF